MLKKYNMLTVSKRAQETQYSPIRKLSFYTDKAEKNGNNVFRLNIGQPDFKTPKVFYQEIKKYSKGTLLYAPSAGYEDTKRAWQEYYKRLNINFNIDEILITTGGSEAIVFTLSSICDPGDEIIVFEPIYPNYITFAKISSVKLVPITLKIEEAFHFPTKQEIIKKISKRTRGILVCNPNNPTGAVYSKKELKNIVDIARKYHLFIISDEVYREFTFNEKKHISLMNFPEVSNQVILIDSVSKRFNICGARIGCLASKNKKIMESTLKFAQGRLSSPTLEQLAIIPLLKNPQEYIKPLLKRFEKCRDIVVNKLRSIRGCFFIKPEGAFYCMVRLPVKNTEKFCRWLLEKFNINKKTLMLAPGSGFYITKKLGKDEIRIAYVIDEKKLKIALNILKKALEVYNYKKA